MPVSALRHARLDADLIQLVLAQRINRSPSRYSLIERGLVEPTQEERARLAAALGRSVEELFPRIQSDSRREVRSA
jgi:transcriptional regulator with XRE-family HTH domain